MSLREQLQSIYDRHGRLTPELVLDEARSEGHPLHTRFEWDDAVAAERYRREQAHELIQSVKISYAQADGRRTEIRAFHAVRMPTGYSYEPAEQIVQDDMATRILLADMEREWQALKRRYQQFAEFAAMVRADLEVA